MLEQGLLFGHGKLVCVKVEQTDAGLVEGLRVGVSLPFSVGELDVRLVNEEEGLEYPIQFMFDMSGATGIVGWSGGYSFGSPIDAEVLREYSVSYHLGSVDGSINLSQFQTQAESAQNGGE